MATRTISTKLAITGESEYRASVSRINGEIKTLQSSLKLTESQFQTNANSMAALEAKGSSLNDLYTAQQRKVDSLREALENARSAEAKYTQQKATLTEKINANNQALANMGEKTVKAGEKWERYSNTIAKSKEELDALKKSSENTSKEQEALEEKIRKAETALKKLAESTNGAAKDAADLISESRKLSDDLELCKASIAATEKGINSWETQLNHAEIQLNDLDAEIKLNNEYLDEAKSSSDGCATSIDRFGDRVKAAAEKSNDLRDALAAAGVIAGLKKTADALTSCCSSSIEFESAMAGVAKTTDLTQEELGYMADAIQDMSTRIPASTTEIASVVESAGQLGIAKEDLLSFSEVMINLGVATNLSSTEAASALAKFANVVGMAPANYERLGSTIVALGNNFATTEADIVSMATRISSAGAIIGLKEPQIMAIATALSSVGIEAEAGGTAISKLLKQFETMVATGDDSLKDFAEVAGMTADEFAKAWKEDAVGALGLFIDGLGQIDDAGGSSIAVLEDLGLTEERLSTAVQSLSSSRGILQSALSTADSAWDGNVALAEEAATRYETTESKLKLLSNACDNVKEAIGQRLTPAVGDLAEAGKNVLSWAEDMIENSEFLVPLLFGAAAGMTAIVAAAVAHNVVSKFASAMGAFLSAMKASTVLGVATALLALAGGVAAFVSTMKENPAESVESLAEAARNFPEAFEQANTTYDDTEAKINAASEAAKGYIDRLRELEDQGELTAAQQAEYKAIVDKIKALLPDVNIDLDEQTGLLVGGADALQKQADAWKNVAIQQALATKCQSQMDAWVAVQLEIKANTDKLSAVQAECNELYQQRINIQRTVNEKSREFATVLNDSNLKESERREILEQISGELVKLDDETKRLDEQIGVNKETQDMLNQAIEIGGQTAQGYADDLAEVENQYKELTSSAESAASATDGASGSMADSVSSIQTVKDGLKDLAEDYKAAYDSAYDSISGQIGLFDEFAVKRKEGEKEEKLSVEEMVKLWNAQARNIETYTQNLQKASEYGLDKGLINSLSDGSAESAEYLATIIENIESYGGSVSEMSSGAENFVRTFNEAFAQTEDAKKSFADTVGGIESDLKERLANWEKVASEIDFSGFAEAVSSAFADVGVDFQEIGASCGVGLSQGLEDSKEDVRNSGKETGEALVAGGQDGVESHSPSKAFYRIGESCGDGLSLGLKSKIQTILADAKSVGLQLTTQMQQAAKETVDSFIGEFNEITGRTSAVCASIVPAAVGAVSGLPGSMEDIGVQSINGMIRGMRLRESALYHTISSIVNNSIEQARKAAAVHSPSEKTTEIFEFVGDGMVVGLENRRKKIKDTAQDVVNDALSFDMSGKVQELSANIDTREPDYLVNKAVNPAPVAGGTSGAGNVVTVYLNIDKFENRSDRDLDEVADYIEDRIQSKFSKKEAAV